jgi:hypothetical protein
MIGALVETLQKGKNPPERHRETEALRGKYKTGSTGLTRIIPILVKPVDPVTFSP